jgi:peptidoglycan/xylan/chitin deacetylase (PgdA/CDA1 family)
VPPYVQDAHIAKAQEILCGWLGRDVVTFVPPGNVCSDVTLALARKHGLRYLSCAVSRPPSPELILANPSAVVAFHDRDLVLNGPEWLARLVRSLGDSTLGFVSTVAADRTSAGLFAARDGTS